MDCSLPGSSVHGIFQARLLEWVAISSCRGSPPCRNQTTSPASFCIGRQILYHWDTFKVWRIQTARLFKASLQKTVLPKEYVKGWKTPHWFRKKSPAPQGMSQRISSFRRSSLCSKGNRWRLATFSETAWSQIRQKCLLHMQNKALTRKRESLNRCWIKPGALDYKEILPVHPKGDQSWVFIGRTDIEAKTPVLWPPDVKNWLIWKDPDAGKDWRQEEKGTTEDEMVGWPHQLNGHEFG